MLSTLIARARLSRALCRRPRGAALPSGAEIVLRRQAARDWLNRRGIRDVRAMGPSAPPRFTPSGEVKP
jgi:hypothetical protein